MGERAGRGVDLVMRGEGSFVTLVAVAFLPLRLISFRRVAPGRPARSGSLTSRVVGKQGEHGEAKGRLSYKRGGER
jgi:hypothetical protein